MRLTLDSTIFNDTILATLAVAGMAPPGDSDKASAKQLLLRALVNGVPNESITAEEKLKRYQLMLTLSTSDHIVDLKAEDITLLKALAGKVYPAVFVGRLHEILETSV
jgi:hypothetical protein